MKSVGRCLARQTALSRYYSSAARTPKHSIYVSESTDPYFNLTLEDWCVLRLRIRGVRSYILRAAGYSGTSRQSSRCCSCIGTARAWSSAGTRTHGRRSTCARRGRRASPSFADTAGAARCIMYVPFSVRPSVRITGPARAGLGQHELLDSPAPRVVRPACDCAGRDAGRTIHGRRRERERAERHMRGQGEDRRHSVSTYERFGLTNGRLYVSGSAYKIVKDRAYHHGTMLISTRLDTLGELLRSNKVRAVRIPRFVSPFTEKQ